MTITTTMIILAVSIAIITAILLSALFFSAGCFTGLYIAHYKRTQITRKWKEDLNKALQNYVLELDAAKKKDEEFLADFKKKIAKEMQEAMMANIPPPPPDEFN